ncbi:MAG TPA: SapC family protein [Povalibacter sp.]
MTTLEILNAQAHQHLRLRPTAAGRHFVQIVASEFAAASVACPILFTKEPDTGRFFAGAILSLKPGEEALKDAAERGGFQPLNLQRDGFFISGENIAVDRSNPRFSQTEGELLFDDAQLPTVHLRQIQRALGQLQSGTEATDAFIRALSELKLIEPIDVALSFDDGDRLTLKGLYTVSLDRLRQIDDAAAVTLFRNGHLQLAYLMAATLQHIAILSHLRNERLVRAL